MEKLELDKIAKRLTPPMKDVLAMMYAVKEKYNITESSLAVKEVQSVIESGGFSLGSLLSFTVVRGDDLEYIKQLFDTFDYQALDIIMKVGRNNE